MAVQDPERRPSSADLLRHEFVARVAAAPPPALLERLAEHAATARPVIPAGLPPDAAAAAPSWDFTAGGNRGGTLVGARPLRPRPVAGSLRSHALAGTLAGTLRGDGASEAGTLRGTFEPASTLRSVGEAGARESRTALGTLHGAGPTGADGGGAGAGTLLGRPAPPGGSAAPADEAAASADAAGDGPGSRGAAIQGTGTLRGGGPEREASGSVSAPAAARGAWQHLVRTSARAPHSFGACCTPVPDMLRGHRRAPAMRRPDQCRCNAARGMFWQVFSRACRRTLQARLQVVLTPWPHLLQRNLSGQRRRCGEPGAPGLASSAVTEGCIAASRRSTPRGPCKGPCWPRRGRLARPRRWRMATARRRRARPRATRGSWRGRPAQG